MCEERRDEISKQGLAMRRGAVELAELHHRDALCMYFGGGWRGSFKRFRGGTIGAGEEGLRRREPMSRFALGI